MRFDLITMFGKLFLKTGTSIASAATIDLATADGNNITITGNTGPVTSLGTVDAGATFTLTFSGTPTLAYNGTSLILPTGGDIVVTGGDVATFQSLGSGNWRCTAYLRTDGTSLATPSWNDTLAVNAETSITQVYNGSGGDPVYQVKNGSDVVVTIEVGAIQVNDNAGTSFIRILQDNINYSNPSGSGGLAFPLGSTQIVFPLVAGNQLVAYGNNTKAGVPDGDDDSSKFYVAGVSILRDTTTQIEYLCTDDTAAAAVWQQQNGTYSPSFTDIGATTTLLSPMTFARTGGVVTVFFNISMALDALGTTARAVFDPPIPPINDFASSDDVFGPISDVEIGVAVELEVKASASTKTVRIDIDGATVPGSTHQIKGSFSYNINN